MSRFLSCRVVLVLALSAFRPAAAASDPPAAKVDAVFADYAKTDSPGCALGVYKDGRIAYSRGYGMASLENGVPITPKTVFYIGSVSKQFTAFAVALLANQGKISLDDDVRKYIPELPDYGTPITIRHLIHHTSGLREKWVLLQLAGWRDGDVVTLQDVLDLARRQKNLNIKPGDEHLYSNTGYDLLAMLVQRVTGTSLREYAQEQIFGPLGMKDTLFNDDRNRVILRKASAYAPREGGGFRLDVPNVDTVGSGGIYSTIEDLALWDESFYTGKLSGRELIEQVETPGRLNSGAVPGVNYSCAAATIRTVHPPFSSSRRRGRWAVGTGPPASTTSRQTTWCGGSWCGTASSSISAPRRTRPNWRRSPRAASSWWAGPFGWR